MHVDQTDRIDDPEAPAMPKKRGRPPKKPTIETVDLSDRQSGALTVVTSIPGQSRDVTTEWVRNLVERYRAEVANHETLDDARKNYALDLLDRLLADLRG